MMNRILKSYRTLKKTLILISVLLFIASCSTEHDPEPGKSDLKFFNYGEWNYITSVYALDDQNSLTCMNESQIMTVDGGEARKVWIGKEKFMHVGMCELKDRGFLQVSQRNYQNLFYTVYSKSGDVEFETSSSDRLFPEYPQTREVLSSAQSDAKGGAYLLVVLVDGDFIFKNYLVHINSQNQIDRKDELLGFFRYMATDDEGNIYLIRTTGSSGQNMRLEISALNMTLYNDPGKIQFNWFGRYESLEVDWKWTDYFPYKFQYRNGSLFLAVTKFPESGDICDGVEIFEINPTDGTEIRRMSADFEFQVDNFRNRPEYFMYIGKGAVYLAMNYLDKSSVGYLRPPGNASKRDPRFQQNQPCICIRIRTKRRPDNAARLVVHKQKCRSSSYVIPNR